VRKDELRNRNLVKLASPRIKWRRTWPISHFFNPILICTRSEFQGRKDEMRNQNLEELTTLKNNMEEQMDNLLLL
jgi:hypothetical protein